MADGDKKGWFQRLREGLTGASDRAPEAPDVPAPAPDIVEQPDRPEETADQLLVPPTPVELPEEVAQAEAPPAPEEPDLPPLEADPGSPVPSLPTPVSVPGEEAPRRGWLQRLREGLAKTSGALGRGITDLFTKKRLDAATLDELEDLLIQADLGIDTATRITEEVGRQRLAKTLDDAGVRQVVAAEVEKVLAPVARPLVVTPARPYVILMVGVNGAGKTTTIGKLASKFRAEGKRVHLAAGDTFRAAAIEQLTVWAERIGVPLTKKTVGADAAALAYEAYQAAREDGADILMIDTAGRLQNKAELMAELSKITRVLKKLDEETPHAVLLVLDATTGQNAVNQVEVFGRTAGVTGLVMTKLDGTARGGILVAIAAKFGLPIHFIGVGESVDDLEPFSPAEFARALVGLE